MDNEILREPYPSGPITILIGPPFSEPHLRPVKVNAMVCVDLLRSVIDRRLLARAEEVWWGAYETFDDPVAPPALSDSDLAALERLGLQADSIMRSLRRCAVSYSFGDITIQSRGSSARGILYPVAAVSLDQMKPVMFIIGNDILSRERKAAQETDILARSG